MRNYSTRTHNEELEICELYKDRSIQIKEIAMRYGASSPTIHNIIRRHNIPKRVQKLSDETELAISKDYEYGNSRILAKLYNVDVKTIFKIVHKYNLSTTKYEVNENFFENLDSKESAYFAGLMSADGFLLKNSHFLGIQLKLTDIQLLEDFKKALDSTHPINTDAYPDSRTGKTYDRCTLRIHRKKLYEDLIKHGIGPNKSEYMEIPKLLPPEMLHYFLRGWSDGDSGWFVKKDQLQFKLISSCNNHLSELNNIFIEKCNLGTVEINDYRPEQNCAGVTYGGNLQTRNIFNYLYQGDLYPRLERKYQLVKNHFNDYDRKFPGKYKNYLKTENLTIVDILENSEMTQNLIDQPKPQSIKEFLKQQAELKKLQNESPTN